MSQNITKTISMLFLMVVVFIVFKYSSAAFFLNKAERLYKDGLKLSGQERASLLLKSLEKVDHTLTLRPGNAEAIDLKAEILYRQWWQNPDGKYLRDSELLQESKALHLQALSIRKKWAFTIAQLARLEAHKPALDETFFERFDEVYDLGRYEAKIALDMMRIGLTRWEELSDDAKIKVIDFTNISVEQKRNKLASLSMELKKAGLFDYMCEKMKPSERKKSLCNLTL